MRDVLGDASRGDATAVVGRRCAQFVLDRLVVLVPVLLLGWLVRILTPAASSLRELLVVFMIQVAVLFVLAVAGWFYVDIGWPYRHDGRTPAMRWLGLRIVRVDGSAPSLRDYLVRTLLFVADGFLWGIVGIVLMLATRRHQRLGDLVTNTLVVRVVAAGEPDTEPELARDRVVS